MKIHVVQKGDTLWKLAEHYGVDFEELKKANTQLTNPDLIMPGMKIKIPTTAVPAKQGIKGMPAPKEAPVAPAPQAVAPITEAPKEMPKVMPKELPKVEMPIPAPAPTAVAPDVMKMVKDAVAAQLPGLVKSMLDALKPEIVNQIKVELDYTKNITQISAPTPKKTMPMPTAKPTMPPAMPKKPLAKEEPKKVQPAAMPCPPGPYGSITMSGYGTGHMYGADQYGHGMIAPGSFGSIGMGGPGSFGSINMGGGYPAGDFTQQMGAMPTAQHQSYAMPQAYGDPSWQQAMPYQMGQFPQQQGFGMHAQPIQHTGAHAPRPDEDCGC